MRSQIQRSGTETQIQLAAASLLAGVSGTHLTHALSH